MGSRAKHGYREGKVESQFFSCGGEERGLTKKLFDVCFVDSLGSNTSFLFFLIFCTVRRSRYIYLYIS